MRLYGTETRDIPGVVLHKTQRSLESAAEEEGDFLLAVQHQRAADAFRQQLWQQRDLIAAVVRHHLGLRKTDTCTVLPPDSWIQGGFNLCVLVHACPVSFARPGHTPRLSLSDAS
jgi:hypothetical protein